MNLNTYSSQQVGDPGRTDPYESPAQFLYRFPNATAAFNTRYQDYIVPAENNCIQYGFDLQAGGAVLQNIALMSAEQLSGSRDMHLALLNEYAFIAQVCQIGRLDSFKENALDERMWGHAIRGYVKTFDKSHQPTDAFVQGYLDTCQNLVEWLKYHNAPRLTNVWDQINTRIMNLRRPREPHAE